MNVTWKELKTLIFYSKLATNETITIAGKALSLHLPYTFRARCCSEIYALDSKTK
jgi:hypothetical protein